MWAVALEKTMLTYFTVEANASFPEHSHESEQITMVLSGSLYFSLAGKVSRAGEGETGGGGKFIRSWKAIEHK